ncbi:MAG: excalibur calcium-binding domain-containing protein [Niallia nealsonii]|uniref:excalibur calcium-binding domain-containing protein n=1 Tax=Niallia alba TaxID=2729105 RepID=UPI0029045496|nr:excalibur calcium-binding domain-containing protein [Niallia nealsonii]MED3795746.1 excalibur calcium-binding domain-containing protein [Niallia alba]
MEILANLGIFLLMYVLIYGIYHIIKKLKNKERRLTRNRFYIPLILGIVFFSIGAPSLDSGLQQEYDKVVEQNKEMTSELGIVKSQVEELDGKYKNLEKDYKELKTNKDDSSSKLTEAQAKNKKLEGTNKELEEKIAELEDKNKSLDEQINDLKQTTASNTESSSSNNSSKQQSSNTNTSTNTASTTKSSKQQSSSSSTSTSTVSTIENFANCTELRKVYPNGVDSSHPAYQAKMDRDKDNFACER